MRVWCFEGQLKPECFENSAQTSWLWIVAKFFYFHSAEIGDFDAGLRVSSSFVICGGGGGRPRHDDVSFSTPDAKDSTTNSSIRTHIKSTRISRRTDRYPAVGARMGFLHENFSREYAVEFLALHPSIPETKLLQKQQELTRAQLCFHQTTLESRIFSIPAVTRISSPSFYPA